MSKFKKSFAVTLIAMTTLTATAGVINNNTTYRFTNVAKAVDRIPVMNRDNPKYAELEKQFYHSGTGSTSESVTQLANALNNAMRSPDNLNQNDKDLIGFWASQPATLKKEVESKISKASLQAVMSQEGAKQKLQALLPEGIFSNLANFSTSTTNFGGTPFRPVSYTLGLNQVNHTTSDLLSSVIFSRNKSSGRADSEYISMSELKRYPAASDQAQIYGRLTSPTGNDAAATDVGGRTASQIATLYEYGYAVGVPKGTENLWEAIGRSIGEFAGNMASRATLSSAGFGAKMFDFFTNIIKSLSGIVNGFDPASILGFGSGGAVGGFLNTVATWLLDTIGMSRGAVRYVVNFIWFIILASFVLSLMISISSARNNSRVGLWARIKRLAIRIIVAVSVIPVSSMITTTIDTMTATMTKDYQIPNEINQKFIVDSLLHAATMNLSLGPVSSSNYNSSGDKDESFRPTPDKVQALNNSIYSIARSTGMINHHSVQTSASDLISAYANNQTYNVNDYLELIKSSSANTAGRIAASASLGYGTYTYNTRFPEAFRPLTGGSIMQQGYFLTENANGGEGVDTRGSEEEGQIKPDNTSQVIIYQDSAGNSRSFKMSPESKYIADSIWWNKPETYIYGAKSATSLTPQHANFTNFIGGPGSHQYKNPETGEDVGKEDENFNITRNNGNTIAMYNRNSGIMSYGGAPSFSTQTTAFLLQSYLDGSGGGAQLEYAGFNTVATDTSSAKNTGKNGNVMVRYVMPTDGEAMYLGKVGALSLLWTTAGISALVAFLYLLRAPIFGALFMCIKSLFSAIATGNLISALTYLAYYTAIKASFAFAIVGAYFGTIVANMLISAMGTDSMTIFAADSAFSIGGILSAAGLSDGLPSAISMLFSIVICVALCWPVLEYKIGSNAVGGKKVSVIGAIVLFPYLLADAAREYLDGLYPRIYGQAKSSSFFGRMKQNVNKVDQGQMFRENKDKLKTLGGSLATGGAMALGAKVAGAKLVGKALTGRLGKGQKADPSSAFDKNNLGLNKNPFVKQEDPMDTKLTEEMVNNAANEKGLSLEERMRRAQDRINERENAEKLANIPKATTQSDVATSFNDGNADEIKNKLKNSTSKLEQESGIDVITPSITEALIDDNTNKPQNVQNMEAVTNLEKLSANEVKQAVDKQVSDISIKPDDIKVDTNNAIANSVDTKVDTNNTNNVTTQDAKVDTNNANTQDSQQTRTQDVRIVDAQDTFSRLEQATEANTRMVEQNLQDRLGNDASNNKANDLSNLAQMISIPNANAQDQNNQMASQLQNQQVQPEQPKVQPQLQTQQMSERDMHNIMSTAGYATRDHEKAMRHESLTSMVESERSKRSGDISDRVEMKMTQIGKLDELINQLQTKADNAKHRGGPALSLAEANTLGKAVKTREVLEKQITKEVHKQTKVNKISDTAKVVTGGIDKVTNTVTNTVHTVKEHMPATAATAHATVQAGKLASDLVFGTNIADDKYANKAKYGSQVTGGQSNTQNSQSSQPSSKNRSNGSEQAILKELKKLNENQMLDRHQRIKEHSELLEGHIK